MTCLRKILPMSARSSTAAIRFSDSTGLSTRSRATTRRSPAMPGHPQVLTNRGHALRRLDRPLEALADFEAALERGRVCRSPFRGRDDAADARRFRYAGWKAYEWRWKTGRLRRTSAVFSPLWLGDVPGCRPDRFLLHAEQGFGDTIQFIRYAPLLAGRRAKVVCEVQPELRSIAVAIRNIEIVPRASRFPRSICIVPCSVFRLPSERSPRRSRRPVPYLAPAGGTAGALARSSAAGATARRICLVRLTLAQE